MTTKVTVDAHAGWPVRVIKVHTNTGVNEAAEEEVIVPANEQLDFYIHQTMWLKVFEEPR